MASQKDLDVWLLEKPDVLNYIYSEFMPDIWISPTTGEEMNRCPWLRKYPNRDQYYCRIDDVRPTVCRSYPVNIRQMKNDLCEMLEPGDYSKSDKDLLIELKGLKRMGNCQ